MDPLHAVPLLILGQSRLARGRKPIHHHAMGLPVPEVPLEGVTAGVCHDADAIPHTVVPCAAERHHPVETAHAPDEESIGVA